MSLLRWTSKSTAKLTDELVRQGFRTSADAAGRLLPVLGYSLQAPSKQKEGTRHPTGTTSSATSTTKPSATSVPASPLSASTVCHYPPGTSKWNRIDHRMFSFISMNWRGRPLTSYRTIIELISATTTTKGFCVRAERDPEWYPPGVKVTDEELPAVPLTAHDWHGEWNYTIKPAAQSIER